jgi:signal transduction histidine kinase
MRAKQSSTASGMYSRTGLFTQDVPQSVLAGARDRSERSIRRSAALCAGALALLAIEPVSGGGICGTPPRQHEADRSSGGDVADPVGDKGLSHDALNLLGAVSLYCDLLSAPGVLKPEHRHYAEELRIVGTRSSALVARLMHSSPAADLPTRGAAGEGKPARPLSLAALNTARPVTLRTIVMRCSGVLGQLAGGRAIEVIYGAAASMPVLVSEETVERILVNLVRNAAAALEERDALRCGKGEGLPVAGRVATDSVTLRESSDGTDDETPGAIRIGVGQLVNRVGDPRPWPFRRVRLTVEDSGCGMTPQQLDQVLCAGGEPLQGGRGIGLRVVRELVALSGGQLRAMSAPGVGTRMQIEWPAVAMASWEGGKAGRTQAGTRTPPRSSLHPPGGGQGPIRGRSRLSAASMLTKVESGAGSDAGRRVSC